MKKQTVTFDIKNLQYFKKLQTNKEKVEFNGEVKFDDSGNITHITAQQGQTVDVCVKGCHINYHTHPEDYVRYYPNHPSLTDMEYILFAVARTHELSVHMVFTPLYIYIITLTAATRAKLLGNNAAEDDISQNVRKLFHSLQKYDRNSDEFRQQWIHGLRRIGYLIERHGGYTTPFQVHLNTVDPTTIRLVEADSKDFVAPVPHSLKTSRHKLTFFILIICLIVWWFNRSPM